MDYEENLVYPGNLMIDSKYNSIEKKEVLF